jgi:hypothetical protein
MNLSPTSDRMSVEPAIDPQQQPREPDDAVGPMSYYTSTRHRTTS